MAWNLDREDMGGVTQLAPGDLGRHQPAVSMILSGDVPACHVQKYQAVHTHDIHWISIDILWLLVRFHKLRWRFLWTSPSNIWSFECSGNATLRLLSIYFLEVTEIHMIHSSHLKPQGWSGDVYIWDMDHQKNTTTSGDRHLQGLQKRISWSAVIARINGCDFVRGHRCSGCDEKLFDVVSQRFPYSPQ